MVRSLLLVPLSLLLFALPAPAGTSTREDLARRLGARLDRAHLPEGRYGIAVLERGRRPRVVFARGHTAALRPASVAKVLTSAAALDLLGPAYVFTTTVTARGDLDARGTFHGDLVVHGTGDPNLSGRLYGGVPTHVLDEFAKAVHDAGIRAVEGALVLDDGRFDREYFHPSWSAADRERWYGAGVTGLFYNDGCADVRVRGAASAGRAGSVDAPSTLGPWELVGDVKTQPGKRTLVGGIWMDDGHRLLVRGSIPPKITYEFSKPVPDPLLFFGGAFEKRLARYGIRFSGGVRAARDAADRAPGKATIARHGTAIGPTLKIMNRRSQNAYAALLFKAGGAALTGTGSWESGRQAVDEVLRRRGLDPENQTRIVDGSGLSLENRTTAATVARLLVMFEADLLRGPLLYGSLAVPGEDGTLERRLTDHELPERLHAKTGTLSRAGVHALAGYLDGLRGEPDYAFAILLNTSKAGRALIDDLVREIAKR
jgi:D-alanyl-D-alanine carboxypeptidase/D-alanyl-D-alanine-endopeptidase (penicillin-binding protein 4)